MAAKQVPQVPPTERAQTSYKQLSLAAINLNSASDELGKAISILEAAIKKLNLGLSAWVELSGGSDFGEDWWTRQVGYTKFRDKWGVALREASGNYQDPDRDSEQLWPFNEGPRWMRAEAIGKIPDLLDALLKQANDTTKKIETKTAQLYEITAAIGDAEDARTTETRKEAKPGSIPDNLSAMATIGSAASNLRPDQLSRIQEIGAEAATAGYAVSSLHELGAIAQAAEEFGTGTVATGNVELRRRPLTARK
jgi:hypothetical protein